MKKQLITLIIGFFLISIISCKKENNKNTENPPVLNTIDLSDITQTTAKSGGNITSDGGSLILARGVCWSINQNPTLSDNKTIDSLGIGTYKSSIIGLKANTTYYLRAYAINAVDTSYGQTLSFSTIANLPTLTTNLVKDITQSVANSGGNITSDGGAAVSTRGICWGILQSPTIADNKTIDGSGLGDFISSLTGLVVNTTYYVRAYATNSSGTAYGNQISFTSLAVDQFTDIDGNIYNSVTIGSQVWMKENLKTTHFRNGDDISNVTDNTLWLNLTTGAYCNYNNDVSYVAIYGRLYNGYAAFDSRNLCPIGWHIPTDIEWSTLETYLGGNALAGGKMKEIGTTHWLSPNSGADNSSGFTGLPSGARGANGVFMFHGTAGYFWSSTESGGGFVWIRYLAKTDVGTIRNGYQKFVGNSIRCIKD